MPDRGTPKTILLLVSDVALSVLQSFLESRGYEVLPATDLGMAVKWLRDTRPDLLLIRPQLDTIPGDDAARYLRKKVPGMRVLMVGGIPEEMALAARFSVDHIEIFPRPFPLEDMLQAIERLIGSPYAK
jgi:DNA-binding response OmpR family regulator